MINLEYRLEMTQKEMRDCTMILGRSADLHNNDVKTM